MNTDSKKNTYSYVRSETYPDYYQLVQPSVGDCIGDIYLHTIPSDSVAYGMTANDPIEISGSMARAIVSDQLFVDATEGKPTLSANKQGWVVAVDENYVQVRLVVIYSYDHRYYLITLTGVEA